jgi:ATP adenylyltransferase
VTDQLWAPWRMEYVLAKKDAGCVFCEYASLDVSRFAEAHVLAATADAFVVLNKYPFAAGHLLVVPNRHEGALENLTEDEHASFFRLVRDAAVRLKKAVSAHGLNVGLNLGRAAGAGIGEHLHAHIVPRWEADTNFMPVLADVRVMPQYLDATFHHLVPAFADIPVGRGQRSSVDL